MNINSSQATVALTRNNLVTLPNNYELEITCTYQTASAGSGICCDDLLLDSGGSSTATMYKLSNTSNLGAVAKFQENDVIKIIKDGTSFSYYLNGTLQKTVTITGDSNAHLLQFRTYKNRGTTFKDLKVKPL